jgi:hypothetical protein
MLQWVPLSLRMRSLLDWALLPTLARLPCHVYIKAVPKGFQPVLDAGQSSQVDLLVSHFE